MNTTKNKLNQTYFSKLSQQNDLKKLITFSISKNSSHLIKINVEISNLLIQPIYNETIKLFQNRHLEGFYKNNVPTDYIEETYKEEINQKLKSYLFSHIIINYLINELLHQKIPFANYPRLTKIKISPEKNLIFVFDISLTETIDLKEWKNFAFKTPKRKRYKDLDKQVKQFIDQNAHSGTPAKADIIEEDDWIYFNAVLLDSPKKPINNLLSSEFWIKIQKNELSNKFKSNFINKKIGDYFITNELNFNDPSEIFDCTEYNFLITIKAIVKGKSFSIDLFKQAFKLKNKTEIHNKIMEVFSYRNDLSQRKTIIEEIFNLFLSKHRFEIPKHLVLRREEDIMSNLMLQPDYHVYKSQKDFLKCVESLAEKNLKEETLIDQISYKENIQIELYDILFYLNLLNNKRISEFAYFKPTLDKIENLCAPLSHSILAHTVLREKTLNHIIHILTK